MSRPIPPQRPPVTDDRLMTTTTASPRIESSSVPAQAPVRAPAPRQPFPAVGRSRNEGHGKRLTAAFEALEVFPALAESRDRLLALVGEEHPSTGDVVRAIESDVALVISVLRLANGVDSPRRGQVESIVAAVEVLSPESVRALATNAETFEFFERARTWDAAPERFRLHAVAVQRAADRLAAASSYPHRDRLLVSSLLHDVGKLVLMHAYPGYPRQVHGPARTPEERLHHERRELGVDHALVGGVLARRWNLPRTLASAIERHHAEDAQGDAAYVRLADMLAHYSQGSPVSSPELLKAARVIGFGPSELRAVLYDLPYPSQDRPRAVEPCPLSGRELDVLKRLAQGMVYKQIAHELSLSTSTVRTHLHNIYGKLGAVDRAQAVLHATERGWL
jgi:HD-like signal output (HDOD) protein/DNA-binding CsgD family transcriptional regulator